MITVLQEVLTELQIPCHFVSADRKIPVVAYSLEKALSRYFKDREGLLTKSSPVDPLTAKILLDHGYKQLSRFGYWCPIKVSITRPCIDSGYLICTLIVCSSLVVNGRASFSSSSHFHSFHISCNLSAKSLLLIICHSSNSVYC